MTATAAELSAIARTPCEDWMRLVWLLCADIGIRSGTARTLPLANFDPRAMTVSLRTKFSRGMTLPITPEIARALQRHPGLPVTASAVAHTRQQRGKSCGKVPTEWTLSKHWTALKKTAGVRPDLHLHDLRRTLAVNVYEHTRDLRAVQAVLGHRSLAATLHYLDHNTTPVPDALLQRLASERVQ